MQLKQLEKVSRKIKVSIPVDGDEFSSEYMTAEYRVLSQNEINRLVSANDDEATLDRIFVGFTGVKDEAGNTIENSAESRAMLCNVPYIRQAIIQGFFEMIAGGDRRKN